MILVDLARERAEAVLAGNGGPVGILAARRSYQQVWARDSMVCGLGLMVARDGALRELHGRSLATLAQHQSPRGKIPHNVGFAGVPDPALVAEGGALPGAPGAAVVDTAHAGCIDSNLWFILGHHARLAATGDAAAVAAAWDALRRAYTWLEYQDSNECGLLEAHEAKDWADLFANRYNTLFANALWYAAHRAMARLARAAGRADEAAACTAAAGDVRFKLNQLLWVGPEVPRDHAWIAAHRAEWSYPTRRIDAELQDRPYYLPYVGFREYGDRFDTFGNLLAVLFGVADARQTARIFDFIRGAGIAKPWPIRVVYPVVHPGDRDWREYYRVRNLNLPHQYHNGGAWPFIGGFYVAALVKARRLGEAAVMLERLAQMNRRGKDSADAWEFNEWFHGESARPMGFPLQSWSAAMFVYAHECVARGACPFFEEEDF
ncbi:MAG TPA: glycoside hydrolase 100 family protein [Kofleriaceae bacterium]|nr:glycoside hydrolase 100 family protein [Kofleriaceae bacterium]